MEASNKRQTSLKIKRLVYIPKKGVNPFGLTPDDPAFWNKGLGLISHYIDELERLDIKVFGK